MGVAVRLGILSTARINRLLLAGARAGAGVEVVAVASRDARRAEAFARGWGIERAHGSYEALLDDPEVDAVYVPLPNSLHVDWSIRALEAGKHVLCEKPLDRRPRRVEDAFDVTARSRLILAEAFMYRHHPQTRHLRDLVRGGAVGTLELVRGAFGFSLTDPANVRLRPELDGGSLMDLGCYCVSAARLVAGEPERVQGEQVVGETGVDMRFHGTLRFPGNVIAQFDSAFTVAPRAELEVVGSEGSLFLGDPWHCRRPVIELRRRDGGVEQIEIEAADPYALELENFAAAIRGDAEPLLGRDDAVAQARALEALYDAAAAGRALPVAPAG